MSQADQPKPGTEGYWSDLGDQADRDPESDHARFYGLKGEEYAVERFDLIHYRSSYYDCLVPPADHRPDTHLPADLQRVQVKGARLKIRDSHGSGGRRGRYRLWERDHMRLKGNQEDRADDRPNLYLFLAYDPDRAKPVQRSRFVPVDDLADVVGGISWYDAGHRTKAGRQTKINVKRLFPDL